MSDLPIDVILIIIKYLSNIKQIRNFLSSHINFISIANNSRILDYISIRFNLPFITTFSDILVYSKLGGIKIYDYALGLNDIRLMTYYGDRNYGFIYKIDLAIKYRLNNVIYELVRTDCRYDARKGSDSITLLCKLLDSNYDIEFIRYMIKSIRWLYRDITSLFNRLLIKGDHTTIKCIIESMNCYVLYRCITIDLKHGCDFVMKEIAYKIWINEDTQHVIKFLEDNGYRTQAFILKCRCK